MPDDTSQAARPGTACLGCRRRKLKCSREQEGCAKCFKADLPCVYPTPEAGVKRKRGPYKKDKPARERHLEDLVKYLEPKAGQGSSASPAQSEQHASPGASAGATYSFRPAAGTDQHPGQGAPQTKPSNAEDLVKDALIALTKSSVNDMETRAEHSWSAMGVERHTLSTDAGLPGSHPSARRMFEYWGIFVHTVDPLVKIIHCPSFAKNLFVATDQPERLDSSIGTLLFSVYFAAVATCTAKESRERFDESRTALLDRYGKTIEARLSDSYEVPTLESLQALILYLISIRRDNGDTSFRAVFSLAVRMAQMIKLHEDPGSNYSPFEAEMRRRLWWQLCGLESRAAEEGVARQTSIMESHIVRTPSNLDDVDLDPRARETPAPRSGVAETSFMIMRANVVSLAHRLWAVKKRFKLEGRIEETAAIQLEQRAVLNDFRLKTKEMLDYCHASRRLDWLILMFYEAMRVKMHMIVEHPTSQIPTKEMTRDARRDLLQCSVTLIGYTLGISKSEKLGDWGWFFRGYMQWHAVAVVIAELGRSTNVTFANNAWAVLDPVLRTWDETYLQKRDEPAWDHVNALIEKARGMRRRTLPVKSRRVDGGVAALAEEARVVEQQPNPQVAYHNSPPAQAWQPQSDEPGTPVATKYMRDWDGLTYHHQQQPEASIPDFPAVGGLLPTIAMDGGLGLGEFDTLENIDFSAFDAVFGDTTWDSSPSMELTWESSGGVGCGS